MTRAHKLPQIVDVPRNAANVPDGCKKKVRLTLFDWKGGDELKQVAGTSDSKREFLVSLRRAASLVRCKRRILLGDAFQFGLLC